MGRAQYSDYSLHKVRVTSSHSLVILMQSLILIMPLYRNGRAMVLGGASRQMVIFTVDDWNAQRVIELPQFVSGVEHVEFLPQSFDSGANKVWIVELATMCTFREVFSDITVNFSDTGYIN